MQSSSPSCLRRSTLRARLPRASAIADVETFVKAVEKAGSLDPKKVREYHRQYRF